MEETDQEGAQVQRGLRVGLTWYVPYWRNTHDNELTVRTFNNEVIIIILLSFKSEIISKNDVWYFP